jgi:hypothetical protein
MREGPIPSATLTLACWQNKLATLTGRGFITPPFSRLVLDLEAPSSRR